MGIRPGGDFMREPAGSRPPDEGKVLLRDRPSGGAKFSIALQFKEHGLFHSKADKFINEGFAGAAC